MKNETNWGCLIYGILGALFVGLATHSFYMFFGIGFLGAVFLKAINGVVTEIRSLCSVNGFKVEK